MEFNIDELTRNPTFYKWQQCTIADLLPIANIFDISVPLYVRKPEIKTILSKELLEKGAVTKAKPQTVGAPEKLRVWVEVVAATAQPTLSIPVAVEVKGPTCPPAVCIDPSCLLQAGMDKEELKLALHLKKVELEEVKLVHLWTRALDLEKFTLYKNSTPMSVRPPSAASSD